MTAMSDSLYQILVCAGVPVGALRSISRTLRGTNGAPIGILGCSHCVVSFMGLQTEFPILVCDLSTDAIIGTDTLGSVLPHTLDIKNGLLFTDGGVSLQLHRIDTALSGVFSPLAIVRYHHTQRQCFIEPCEQWAADPCPPAGYWKDLHYLQKIRAFVVGRTFVDPSKWSVPVLVSNFSQETVMVKPFSEVGMVAHISAIQSITEPHCRASCSEDSLPTHLQEWLDQTSRDLDGTHQRQLASVLLQYFSFYSRCPVQHLPVTRMQWNMR